MHQTGDRQLSNKLVCTRLSTVAADVNYFADKLYSDAG